MWEVMRMVKFFNVVKFREFKSYLVSFFQRCNDFFDGS